MLEYSRNARNKIRAHAIEMHATKCWNTVEKYTILAGSVENSPKQLVTLPRVLTPQERMHAYLPGSFSEKFDTTS